MEWYWWPVILVALAGFVTLKIKIGGAWMRRQKEKKENREKNLEDED